MFTFTLTEDKRVFYFLEEDFSYISNSNTPQTKAKLPLCLTSQMEADWMR
jgi:hypothetical protein